MTATPDREPPISYRLGQERAVRFEAFQKREKLTRSDALHVLIDAGLDAAGFPTGKPSAASKVEAHIGPVRPAPGSRLKVDPAVKKRWKV